ncbi:MAG: ferrous iron transport protein B [Puniceicoccales bacterium]|jgi:ferrous iron transport protein B|nr:ferrous iron transport protein B [Puniceicoccales bacterium]
MPPSLRIALVGNPNSGKTSLFNALTGSLRRVANHGGVTVTWTETAFYDTWGHKHVLIDLPGAYSLFSENPEEAVLGHFLLSSHHRPDRILCVVDAQHLRKSLYLVHQVLSLKIPSAVLLTMEDLAQNKGFSVRSKELAERLGIPVFRSRSWTPTAKIRLKEHIGRDQFGISPLEFVPSELEPWLPKTQGTTLERLFLALKKPSQTTNTPHHSDWKTRLVHRNYRKVDEWYRECIVQTPRPFVDWDRWLLHPRWGKAILILIFTGFLGLTFAASDGLSRAFTILYIKIGHLFSLLPENRIRDLLAEGIWGGVGNVLIFLPQLACWIFLVALLENTGYLARLSFSLDRWMKHFGLSGRCFIPLLSCCSCTVSGLQSTRCIRHPAERSTTLFVGPWIPCSGQLPIYFLLISLLCPKSGGWVKAGGMTVLYFFGIFSALVLAKCLRVFWFKDRRAEVHFIEIPTLRKPQWSYVFRVTYEQTKSFLCRAGTLIWLFNIGVWGLLNFPHSPSRSIEHTWLARIGRSLEPIFEPVGCDWKIGISLLSSYGARENFIGTLGVIQNIGHSSDNEPLSVLLQREKRENGQPRYDPALCLGLMVFFSLSTQCLGICLTLWHESGRISFALKQFLFTGAVAYLAMWLVYHGVTLFL